MNDSPEVEIEQPTTKVEFEYKVIKHKKNSGIHQARVTGLSYCTEIMFCFWIKMMF